MRIRISLRTRGSPEWRASRAPSIRLSFEIFASSRSPAVARFRPMTGRSRKNFQACWFRARSTICSPLPRSEMAVKLGALMKGHRSRIREILDATTVFREDEVAVALELFDEAFAAGPPRAPYDPGDGVANYE